MTLLEKFTPLSLSHEEKKPTTPNLPPVIKTSWFYSLWLAALKNDNLKCFHPAKKEKSHFFQEKSLQELVFFHVSSIEHKYFVHSKILLALPVEESTFAIPTWKKKELSVTFLAFGYIPPDSELLVKNKGAWKSYLTSPLFRSSRYKQCLRHFLLRMLLQLSLKCYLLITEKFIPD